MKLKYYDWCVLGLLAALAIGRGFTVALLSVIAGLFYLFVRRYAVKTNSDRLTNDSTVQRAEDDEFTVHESHEHGYADYAIIAIDRDISYRPSPGHFRLDSRFDLASSTSEYEYKVDGTSVSIRLLNSYEDGESSHFKKEWGVRDGVVLESDLRSRWEAKELKFRSIDETIANLKGQVEWEALRNWSFNGFPYYVVNRALPAPDARRFLRQELERLKLGNARVNQEISKYGLEPDPSPQSTDGWRWIPGGNSEGIDQRLFWDALRSGTFGVSEEETGKRGNGQILALQKILGDVIECGKRL